VEQFIHENLLQIIDYVFISKSMESAIQNAKIVPNIFSDHSAITLSMSLESNETEHGLDRILEI